ncbi:GTP-binding protein Era [Spiroplasma gladiatoris]|uniref:GTPase Era n=1 Tax=Spiroplasma gladiatoris TaxID=2143 RepID=A0A4P7AI20_9MOLU|nr:GTPase Era [Spiroplasma gladiatoris]QBQ07897.1 GTP-binding protein Era [Spiroplasma gladiatoris]
MEKIKSGFISIIGRPNVGKSTLLNTILEKKISIITPKAQTTRNKISGILTKQDCQYVFVDTPGVHKAQNELDRYMNKIAIQSTKGVDVILFLAPSNEFIGDNDKFILNTLKERDIPVFLVITKSDLVSQEGLEAKVKSWKNQEFKFAKILTTSATSIESISSLLEDIKEVLPETGIKFYPDDQYTDQPERFIIREIIREEILLQTEQEIPHSVAILIDKLEDKPEIIKIIASIVCERSSQKGIIIGNKGSKIKQIGIKSREKIEDLFSNKVYLELFVKVKEKWRNSASLIKQLGYDKDSY